MPGAPIQAKGIQNFNATVTNGYLNFTYVVVDNYNPDTSLGDRTTEYSYYFPANLVSLTLINNQTSGSSVLFELSYQNKQISFSAGEYFDISNGTTLDVGAVYGLIIGALGI